MIVFGRYTTIVRASAIPKMRSDTVRSSIGIELCVVGIEPKSIAHRPSEDHTEISRQNPEGRSKRRAQILEHGRSSGLFTTIFYYTSTPAHVYC